MSKDLKQEMMVFHMLCPEKLKKILDNPKITFEEYSTIIKALNTLGFEEYSSFFALDKFDTAFTNCGLLPDGNSDATLKKCTVCP